MAPHRTFKYDIVQLLSAIRDRPVLWDRTLEIYKDKVERKNAWDEICQVLDDKFEQMTWEEKNSTVNHVINKWTNVRDTFVKSVKNKIGKSKKKYSLYEHLKFLTKVVPEGEIHEDYNVYDESSTYMKQEVIEEQVEGPSSSFPTSSRKKRRSDSEEYVPKKSKTDRRSRRSPESSRDSDYETYDAAANNIDFVEVDPVKVESDPRVMNEDEAFFASLLPTVVRYNEDERLEFRIQVLAVMKSIKDKRTW